MWVFIMKVSKYSLEYNPNQHAPEYNPGWNVVNINKTNIELSLIRQIVSGGNEKINNCTRQFLTKWGGIVNTTFYFT